ncbi:DUF3102 domain-containing protein [Candidatus Formimonas warabiya]|uniref:DUF3102 domain-containing protein n=1 Tax=Formimonas warabiya TaxID=1761012 RepID=A0A3G1KNV0_FORW1|nr:DUF3102 domain-containing protein [Candidatus Formimonas warabiya]ATW24142.1 hypothetical protein DCMF_04515 [Candidatus Formimonas warabiya]
MEAPAIYRTPELIAAEINNIKRQTRTMLLYNSIEIGRRLYEAKNYIPHGEWGKWLQESVEYSQSTANNLMRIFEEYGADQLSLFDNNAKSQALGILSYTQAVALLGIPQEEREQFIEDHDVDNMSSRELQAAIKERDKALKEKQKLEKTVANIGDTVTQISKERDKLRDEASQLRSDMRVTNDVLKEKQDTVKTLGDVLKAEREQSKAEMEKLSKLLDEARKNGSSDEKVKQLEEELKVAQRQIDVLNDELKKPVELEPAVVEKIPEEVEKELEELRKKAAQQNPAAIKFKVIFDGLVKNFQELLATLAEIGKADPEAHEKYKNAVAVLIGKMGERL